MKIDSTGILVIIGALIVAFTTPVAAELTEIENQYRTAYQLHVGDQFEADLADLNARYAGALNRALKKAIQDARLDEAVSLRDEIRRVNEEAPIPEGGADDGVPEIIVKLRETYHEQLSRLEAERNQRAKPILEKFGKELAAYQEQLTKAGKLDEAIAVKSYREEELAAKLFGGELIRPESESGSGDSQAPESGLSAGSSDLLTGLVVHFTFDEDEGSRVSDQSGHRNHARSEGAEFEPEGKHGGGFRFDNSYLEVDRPKDLPSGNAARTLCAWVKYDGPEGLGCIGEYGADQVAGTFGIRQSKTTLTLSSLGRNVPWHTSNSWSNVSDGEGWHHLAATYDSKETVLYFDGQKKGATTSREWSTIS